jgi:hypothetical protein
VSAFFSIFSPLSLCSLSLPLLKTKLKNTREEDGFLSFGENGFLSREKFTFSVFDGRPTPVKKKK